MADTVRVTDHAAEAVSLLGLLPSDFGDIDVTEVAAVAQVHATLAVAQAIREMAQTQRDVAAGERDHPMVEAAFRRIPRGEPRG